MGKLHFHLSLLAGAACFLLLPLSPAVAQTRVLLGGNLVLSQYDYTGDPSTKGGMGFGGLFLIDVPAKSGKFSIESGVMYLKRSFTDTDSGGTDTVRSVDSLVIPVTAWIGSRGGGTRFAVGAGPYFNQVLKYDGYFGVQGQVRVTFGKKSMKWFVGAQYLKGLQEDQVGVAHEDVLVQGGFQFGGK